jgi:hypothetical protein
MRAIATSSDVYFDALFLQCTDAPRCFTPDRFGFVRMARRPGAVSHLLHLRQDDLTRIERSEAVQRDPELKSALERLQRDPAAWDLLVRDDRGGIALDVYEAPGFATGDPEGSADRETTAVTPR